MKRFVLIGKPLRHSASPALFRHWFRRHGLSAEYSAKEIHGHEIAGVLADVENGRLAGANVTLPYKETVFQELARRDDAAEAIGAVNTLMPGSGGVLGLNTDAPAFAACATGLLGPGRWPPEAACVFGAGGAARAAVWALGAAGAASVRVVSRHPAAAEKLRTLGRGITAFSWGQAAAAARGAALLVNATPLGQEGFASFPALPLENSQGGGALDLVYNPARTGFLSMAENAGFKTANGFSMLLGQGALSFEAWFGFKPESAGLTFEALARDGERKRA